MIFDWYIEKFLLKNVAVWLLQSFCISFKNYWVYSHQNWYYPYWIQYVLKCQINLVFSKKNIAWDTFFQKWCKILFNFILPNLKKNDRQCKPYFNESNRNFVLCAVARLLSTICKRYLVTYLISVICFYWQSI